eukprot:CAMPEP_0185255512 /NCGR_PEP_ID=MMETSP1359-20130426/4565_1 /TAXON_ID=552665 /ORGANISM="Bigelowiella longifila, Strain CCMP242" /LENGTH=292 /DNA_ID=CAMNT_0027839479 /DNA_START=33 /DNA_END=911 /DNA_ORIENTATION=-
MTDGTVLYLAAFRLPDVDSKQQVTPLKVIARWPKKRQSKAEKKKIKDIEPKCKRIAEKMMEAASNRGNRARSIKSFKSDKDDYTIHSIFRPEEANSCAFFAVTFLDGKKNGFEKSPSLLLKKLVSEFTSICSEDEVQRAKHNTLYPKCESFLETLVNEFGSTKLSKVHRQVAELKEKSKDMMRGILDRGEDLALLDEDAEDLRNGANDFKNVGNNLKWKFWKNNLKWGVCLAVIMSVLIIVIVTISVCVNEPNACGGTKQSGKGNTSNPSWVRMKQAMTNTIKHSQQTMKPI